MMSIALVFGLFQLLLLMMSPAAEGGSLGRKSDVRENAAVPDSSARRAADDSREQSELVSRRRWYGSQLTPWNDHDIQWLKRGAPSTTDVDKRGWGNGIPPWMKHRVIVPKF